MSDVTTAWIRATDEELARREIPARRRPWSAWSEWSKKNGPSSLSGPAAQLIFKWYEENYTRDAFIVGSLFTGALYFDQGIWPVEVPLVYGRCRLDVNGMVASMPSIVFERMAKDQSAFRTFAALAADCIDYGLGFDDLANISLASSLATNMLVSADKELRSAVVLLLSNRPNQKVAESARLATEMFLKGFLAHYTGLDERGARNIGHNLHKALDESLAHDPSSDLRVLSGLLGRLPAIAERYRVAKRSIGELWSAYSLAQIAGTALVRSLSDRDCRPSMMVS